eukprot:578360-Rhodomonas_salina.1
MPVLYNADFLEELGKQIGHPNLDTIVNDIATTYAVMCQAYGIVKKRYNFNGLDSKWLYRLDILDTRAKQEGGLVEFWKKMQSDEYFEAIQSMLTIVSKINNKMVNFEILRKTDFDYISNSLERLDFQKGMDYRMSFQRGNEYILQFQHETQPFDTMMSERKDLSLSRLFMETSWDARSILSALPHVHENMMVLQDCTSRHTKRDGENTQWVWAVFHSRLGSNAPMR